MTGKHLRAAHLRKEQTDAERKMWILLRDRRLESLKFRRQVPMGPYVVDLFCPKRNLIIELDGGQHNESLSDEKRTAWLETRGYRILRFWNNDVLQSPEGALTVILSFTKSPSPLEGEGRGEGSTGFFNNASN
jgi:very-short-patch-repair endonuclease